MKNIIAAILLLCSMQAIGQDSEEIFDFTVVENKPVFQGCEYLMTEEDRFKCMNVELMKYIAENFNFPKKAAKKGVQGKIYVSFVIEKNGEVDHVRVVRGVHPLLNKEAKRVVKSLPKFTPARQRGKPVRMQYTVPINARLK